MPNQSVQKIFCKTLIFADSVSAFFRILTTQIAIMLSFLAHLVA